MVTLKEKQDFRKTALKKLKAIKKEAYSKMTCDEYNAINITIRLIELKYAQSEGDIRNG